MKVHSILSASLATRSVAVTFYELGLVCGSEFGQELIVERLRLFSGHRIVIIGLVAF